MQELASPSSLRLVEAPDSHQSPLRIPCFIVCMILRFAHFVNLGFDENAAGC